MQDDLTASPLVSTAWLAEQWRSAHAVPGHADLASPAAFAAFLRSDAANCFVGRLFPICGGWALR